MKDFSERARDVIRAMRQQAGLIQEDYADVLGIGASSLRNYEKKGPPRDLDLLGLLAKQADTQGMPDAVAFFRQSGHALASPGLLFLFEAKLAGPQLIAKNVDPLIEKVAIILASGDELAKAALDANIEMFFDRLRPTSAPSPPAPKSKARRA